MPAFLIRPDLLQIRAPAINFYALRAEDGIYLIDAGFIGGQLLLERALARAQWRGNRIRGIIVTHGHLDHILNVRKVAARHGAWIAAPRLDAPHYACRPTYQGWAVTTAILEAIGRPVLGFTKFHPDRELHDGDLIEVWHGLRAVHLPGHTAGHMGFYCEKLKWLFSGDLFSSYSESARLPPPIFNSVPSQIPASIERASSLGAAGVIPNHGDCSPPETHLRRLERLHRRLSEKQKRS